jgi:transposase
VINQILAFLLERGIAVRQGLRALRTEMPIVLAMTDKLSPRMIHMIKTLCTDWRHLDGRIETVSDEIKTLSEQDDGAKRLMTVPGIGPIISTATVAAIGSGDAFSKGRDFGAWLGLVPRQMSTGGRTILGPISKRGNRCSVPLSLVGRGRVSFLTDMQDATRGKRWSQFDRGGC